MQEFPSRQSPRGETTGALPHPAPDPSEGGGSTLGGASWEDQGPPSPLTPTSPVEVTQGEPHPSSKKIHQRLCPEEKQDMRTTNPTALPEVLRETGYIGK